MPPHVDWPDLKDELRKVSPNPIWVRVTPDRKGVFTVKESDMDSLYGLSAKFQNVEFCADFAMCYQNIWSLMRIESGPDID